MRVAAVSMPSTVPSGIGLIRGGAHHDEGITVDVLTLLHEVAAPTGIDEIWVFDRKVGAKPLRLKVINVEFTRDMAPLFALQAVHAAKGELVPQPRAIRFIIRITARSVATMAEPVGIIEYQSDVRSCWPVPSSCRCSRLAPSSGSVSSVSQQARISSVRRASSIASSGDSCC